MCMFDVYGAAHQIPTTKEIIKQAAVVPGSVALPARAGEHVAGFGPIKSASELETLLQCDTEVYALAKETARD